MNNKEFAHTKAAHTHVGEIDLRWRMSDLVKVCFA